VHAGVVDDVAEFRSAQPKIQWHEDGAQTRGGEHRLDERRLVEADEADPIALAHTIRSQSGGEAIDPLPQLAVGPGRALKCQSLAMRCPQRALIEPITEPDIGSHGVPSRWWPEF